jgi:hypothetical protein
MSRLVDAINHLHDAIEYLQGREGAPTDELGALEAINEAEDAIHNHLHTEE